MDVSIIVPLYYGRKYLPVVLETVRRNCQCARDLVEIELVLVNDSPEEVPDFSVLREEFPIVTVINKKNEGIHRSRINGLNRSSGTYVLFLDQDDELAEDAIRSMFDRVHDGDAISSDWVTEREIKGEIVPIYKCGMVSRKMLAWLLRGGNCIGPPGHCLIRRDRIPTFWQTEALTVNGADDYLLWLCMLSEGCSFQYCDKKLYTHKFNVSSCSADGFLMLESEEEAFLRAAQRYGYNRTQIKRYLKHAAFRKEMYPLWQQNASGLKKLLVYCKYPSEIWFRMVNTK